MCKFFSYTLLLLLGFSAAIPAKAASVCDSASGNIVTNCGFENGNFSGWSVTGNLIGGIDGNYVGVDSSNPNSGNYEAYFGAPSQYLQTGMGSLYGPPTTLSQTVAGLPSQYYEVSFYLDQDGCTPGTGGGDCGPGYHNYLDAWFNGVELTSQYDVANSGGAYNEYVFVVPTTGGASAYNSDLLQFDFTNDEGYWYVDDVTVTSLGATPEPASLLLVAPVLGGLYFLRRSRRGMRSGA